MNRKAISLISGGLDSAIATKLVLEQGVDVVGLHYTSPFVNRKEREGGAQAIKTAEELGIRLVIKDKGPEYLEVVRNPKHGYGKNMNPCIDCRIFMLKQARSVMEEEQAGFIVTGEVLGQRPMSQRRDTIHLIERASGLDGLIVRPLSAKLFPPTIPEIEGVIDRNRLLNVSGRSRAAQYSLAAGYDLKEFSCPAGGCLLTDPIFSVRLRDLFANDKDFTTKDVELLNLGRHFRLSATTKLVIGRNQGENKKIVSLWSPDYALFHPVGFKGPQGIMKGNIDEKTLAIVATIIAYYGKYVSPVIQIESNNGLSETHSVEHVNIDVESLRI